MDEEMMNGQYLSNESNNNTNKQKRAYTAWGSYNVQSILITKSQLKIDDPSYTWREVRSTR